MQRNNQHILITATVDESLIKKITDRGLQVDVIPFIKTTSIQSSALQQQIKNIIQLDATVVFTSSNAVHAIADLIQDKKPNWKIYCTGNTTKDLLENISGRDSIKGIGNNAIEVAEQIIADNKTSEVYFFCGDKKRDELPSLLIKRNIVVHAIEVYTTTTTNHKVEKDYDGILFFSPSAVEGFFTSNKLNVNTTLFTIGNTTADEIKRYSANKIIVSNKPGKKELVEKAIEYFKTEH